ncbi:MAG: energy-coupled thiamine transporter ThiT [Bacilli bacterium]|nr:energy-coupled thiamine transporter ThiT [Bacilli bacterium]
MNKSTNTVRTITEIGLFAALGFALDELQGIISKGLFVNGGSIGFAMIAVLIITFRRGTLAGFVTGLIMGLLDVATGPYILNFWQVILDYVISYSLVAASGLIRPFFSKRKNDKEGILILLLATLLGGIAKFVSHYLAGVIFWADPSGFAWELTNMNPYLYCFIYNIAFIGPSIILCGILMIAIFKKAPQIIIIESEEVESQKHLKLHDYIVNPIVLLSGLFLFIYFLIKYINSYESEYDGYGTDVSFSSDALVLMVSGFLLIVVSGITMIKTLKNIQNNRLTIINILILTFANVVYPIARLIKMYNKGNDPTIYWIWFAVGIFLNLLFIGLYLFTKKLLKQNNEISESTI